MGLRTGPVRRVRGLIGRRLCRLKRNVIILASKKGDRPAVDIDLLKTFLEVNRARHFGRAAERLFVTQSAVSARIRLLEETLGVPLFTRKRNDLQLTPSGTRLLKHAESIVNVWEQARQEAGLEGERSVCLAIGAVFDLWDVVLKPCLQQVHGRMQDTALVAEVASAQVLIRRVLDGALDLGFLFEPPHIPELAVRQVAAVPLVLVSTRPGLSVAEALCAGYVMVNWGQGFAASHARYFPDIPVAALQVGLASLAQALILGAGGAAYLARQSVADLIAAGSLHLVAEAPVIERFAFAVYREGSEREDLIRQALALLTGEE